MSLTRDTTLRLILLGLILCAGSVVAFQTAAAAGAPGKPLPKGPPRDRRAPRTLEDIAIQGEIDLPEVLFITGRPRPFYDDRLHRLYSPTTRQLIAALTTPGAVLVRPIGGSREASR